MQLKHDEYFKSVPRMHLFAGLGLAGGSSSPGLPRSSTPTARSGSAGGRAASAPRSASAKARALASATIEAQSCNNRAVSTSRRKLKRFENAHLHDVTRSLMGLNFGVSPEEHEETLAEEDRTLLYGVVVDIRSAFGELFEDSNRNELELFRSCGESALPQRNPRRLHAPRQWLSVSEAAWMQVERRLRSIVRRAVLTQPELKEYVQALEFILVCISESSRLPPLRTISPVLLSMLSAPLELMHHGPQKEKHLTISLKDSSFHRLLLHTVSQFYGLRSKSVSRKKGGGKVTVVVFGRHVSAALQSRASLWGYLLVGGDSVEGVAEAETDADETETETESNASGLE